MIPKEVQLMAYLFLGVATAVGFEAAFWAAIFHAYEVVNIFLVWLAFFGVISYFWGFPLLNEQSNMALAKVKSNDSTD